ncbi:diaminopimelate decarboxylase [Victivallis vadensis]|jgi:diaminopimelate decarboxylase|uniref:diaminopimelate decarboxylase n=1 Tax=Victivallis vadensis TaxID=172901 RepID=UPI001D654FF6|nr:diaminopimelate decarboxylase [Victivallis vadensis]HJH03141.1 diaminopimelate decarboxylase [Victivallis vadensis]
MISDESLLEFAKEYGTPLYVYDGDLVVERYRDLFKFIPYDRLKIHYALKANYNPGLLTLLRDAGAGLDTVSPGEVVYALKLGFPRERIIYTANNMTDAEFEQVLAMDVVMNIGSLSRLRKIAKQHPGMKLCLRFNPDVCDGDNEKTMTGGDLTKFGILLESVEEVKALVKEGNLRVIGLHEHTGSGLQHAESVYQSMDNLMAIATPENFPDLEFLDFGGGFKVPYKPEERRVDYVAMGAEIARRFTAFTERYGRRLDMLFEPGKYMVAEAGHLLTEVNTIKHNRTRVIAGCDSGFPQLIRPVLYGAYHQIRNLSNPAGKPVVYDVCGNICETGDRFAEQRELPEIREYDILAIGNAGAYCYSMGGVYNLRPMPGEIVVSGGKVVSERRKLTTEELAVQILGECSAK